VSEVESSLFIDIIALPISMIIVLASITIPVSILALFLTITEMISPATGKDLILISAVMSSSTGAVMYIIGAQIGE